MGSRHDVFAMAAEQEGLVSRQHALDRGVSGPTLDRMVRSGDLHVMHPGVYRSASTPDDQRHRLAAAVMAAGPGALLSHRSAAFVHGVVGGRARPVELLVEAHRCPTLDGVLLHRSFRIPPDHSCVVDGVPATTIDRTLADLGSVVPPAIVARAVQEAVVRKMTTTERLYRLADTHGQRGRSGIGALRAALDDWMLKGAPPESDLEIMFGRLVERTGIPHPTLQHRVFDDDREIARVDAAWVPERIAVEVDSLAHHGTAERLDRDLARQNRLILAGWLVLRFTWNDMVRRQARVAAEVVEALQARSVVS